MSEQLVTPENVTTKDGKINLLDLNRQQMREFFKDLGEKPFRADQVMKWMYHYCCDNFDEMTDINKVLRGKLKEVAEIRAPEVVEEQRSSDGTIKWAIAVGDQRVETVYIPEDDRATLCVSSQVGCALECKFCSTAQQGFNRNLRVSEIIGQVWRAAKIVGAAKVTGQRPITNVVMMGIEYVMLDHVNDGTEHAHQLAELLKDTPCKINLIPWNPFPGAPYGRSSNSRIDRFSKVLMSYGFTTIVRKTRGDDIDAACGQLAGDVIDRTKRTLRKRMQGEAIDIKAV